MAACGAGLLACQPWTGGAASSSALSPQQESFEVVAPYAATLLNALESAAGEAAAENPYQAWLSLGPHIVPLWMLGYRSARVGWQRGPYFEHVDASFVPHMRCGYQDVDVGEIIGCVQRVVPRHQRQVAKQALEGADAGLWPRWPGLRAHLQPLAVRLQSTLSASLSTNLLWQLRRMLGVSPYLPLKFRVVLVAAPQGVSRIGRREDSVLIIEVNENEAWIRPLLTTFHELAHLASAQSPAFESMETEFARLGYSGFIASHYCNEVVATAFEQLAAQRFDPTFDSAREFYGDAAIDALAHAVYEDWRQQRSLSLGVDFARRLTALTRAHWPMARWRLRDVLFRVVVFAEKTSVLQAYRRAAQPHALWGVAPLPEDLQRPASSPLTASRLVLMENRGLSRHAALLEQFGLRPAEVQAVAHSATMLFRSDDYAGVPIFLVVAPDTDGLLRAARVLGEQASTLALPAHGWHTLLRQGA